MISQALQKARKYEEELGGRIAAEDRPAFHLSTRVGWLNDPNGFSFYKGEYHMFYQYHPYDSVWGPMHWGHAVSKDLLHWAYLPAALAPDEEYDRDGCFSGSAVELPDGRQLLVYTGVARKILSDGSSREVQTQCLAVGDGVNYEKYGKNPILDKKDLPEGASEHDFRDPKIWRREDGSYRCLIGSRPAEGGGQALLYASKDAFHWKFQKTLVENKGRFGMMWECPDFFALDGKWALVVSPQDMLPRGFEYHNGNGTLCLIGDYSEETEVFTEEADQAVDYGIDFYAPQTILTPDGRRVMIGWMQNWDTCNVSGPNTKEKPWFGQMSLPRELCIRNGRLCQWPIRELDSLRQNEVRHEDVSFEGVICLDGVKGRMVDMEIELFPADAGNVYQKFAVRFAQDEQRRTAVSFRPHESILKIDRKFSGSRRAIIHQRRCLIPSKEGRLRLRLILDRFSVEVFANDGEYVMTATLYTDQAADGISFFADGGVRMNVVKYDLRKH